MERVPVSRVETLLEVCAAAELPAMAGQEKDRLRTELLRALKEGYSKDYQYLIQLYFEALQQDALNETSNN